MSDRRGSVADRRDAVFAEDDEADGEAERSLCSGGGGEREGDEEGRAAPSADEGRRNDATDAADLIGGLGSGRTVAATDDGPGTGAEGDGSEEEQPPLAYGCDTVSVGGRVRAPCGTGGTGGMSESLREKGE